MIRVVRPDAELRCSQPDAGPAVEVSIFRQEFHSMAYRGLQMQELRAGIGRSAAVVIFGRGFYCLVGP